MIINSPGRSTKKVFFQGVVGSIIAQLSTMVFGVLSVYFGIRYFGAIVYGIWVTIKSILGFSNFTLFGIDAVSATLLAQASKTEIQKTIVARSLKLLVLLMLIGLIVATFIILVYPQFFSIILGKIEFQFQSLSIFSLAILLIGQLIQLPFTMCISIFTGLQQIHLAKFYQVILPGALNFLALIITILLKQNLIFLSALTAISMISSAALGLLHVFIQNRAIRFKLTDKLSDFPSSKYLLNKGSRYFMFGLANVFMMNSDNLVINHFQGPSQVSRFAIAYKLFSLMYVSIALINSAIWPIFSNKVGSRQWKWLNEHFNFLVSVSLLLGGLMCLGGIAFAKPIIILWAGKSNYAGNLTTVLFAIYSYALSFSILNTTMLNSLNETKLRSWLIPLEMIINLTLSIILINFIGISGVALGTLIALLITEIWLYPLNIYKQTLKKVYIQPLATLKHLLFSVLPLAIIFIFLIDKNNLLDLFLKSLLLLIYPIVSWLTLPKTQKIRLRIATRQFSEKFFNR